MAYGATPPLLCVRANRKNSRLSTNFLKWDTARPGKKVAGSKSRKVARNRSRKVARKKTRKGSVERFRRRRRNRTAPEPPAPRSSRAGVDTPTSQVEDTHAARTLPSDGMTRRTDQIDHDLDEIDHDLDHIDPNLPLVDVVQDLHTTYPRSCRFVIVPPGNMIQLRNISARKYLDHELGIGHTDHLSETGSRSTRQPPTASEAERHSVRKYNIRSVIRYELLQRLHFRTERYILP